MVRPGMDRLPSEVEVDETYVGDVEGGGRHWNQKRSGKHVQDYYFLVHEDY